MYIYCINYCYVIESDMLLCLVVFFFFFKQKTAYEMRISDWSSDVCSSDLLGSALAADCVGEAAAAGASAVFVSATGAVAGGAGLCEIGRASCRERVCQFV